MLRKAQYICVVVARLAFSGTIQYLRLVRSGEARLLANPPFGRKWAFGTLDVLWTNVSVQRVLI